MYKTQVSKANYFCLKVWFRHFRCDVMTTSWTVNFFHAFTRGYCYGNLYKMGSKGTKRCAQGFSSYYEFKAHNPDTLFQPS